MKKVMAKGMRTLVLVSCLVFAGCSTLADPFFQSGTMGGLIGAGLGTGAGALVGSSLTNGDIAQSAIAGGAIGLSVGILAGVAYRSYIEQRELRRNAARIQQNYDQIVAREQEIGRMREELFEDSIAIVPDRSLREEIYDGSTIGTYNR